MIVDLFKEWIGVIKAHIPTFNFGYLERLVPLLDITDDGYVLRTDLKYSAIYEIYPRAVSLLDEQAIQEIRTRFESYARNKIQVGFYSINKMGIEEDFQKFLEIYRGKGIFEEEALSRKHLFEKSLSRRFYVSFTSPNLEQLKNMSLSEFPFTIKKRLNADEVFTLYRNIFRDFGEYDLESAVLAQLEVYGYASIRELIFPAEIELKDDSIKIGDWYCVPVEVDAISTASPHDVLFILQSLDEAFYSMHVDYISKVEAIEIVEKKLREVKGAGFSKTSSFYHRSTLEKLLSHLKLTEYNDPLARYSFKVLVFDRNEEKVVKEAERLRQRFGTIGFQTYKMVDMVSVMATSLPAMETPRKMVMFNDAVSTIPAYVSFIGYERPVVIFEKERDLIYFDPIDKKSTSWGIGIFGPTGMGKSNIANAIIKSLKALDSWIVIMDIGDSYKEICAFFDGEYVKIDTDGKYRINPFQFRFGFTTVPNSHVLFVIQVLETLLRQSFLPEEKAIITQYINFLYKEKTLKSESWSEYLGLLKQGYTPEIEKEAYIKFSISMPKLSDFMEYFDSFIENLTNDEEKRIARKLSIVFKGLSMNPLFEGNTNFMLTKDFTVFELKSLQTYPELLEAFYLLLQKMINEEVYYSTPDPDSTPKSIIDFYGEEELFRRWQRYKVFLTDEFHFVKNSRPIIEDTAFMYRTGRKKNLIRIVISQFLTDLTIFGQDVFDGIVENTAVLLFAPHRAITEAGDKVKAYEAALIETAKLLHLSEEEIKEFQSMRRTSEYAEYYLVSRNRGRTSVRYKNSPIERWLYATYTRDVVIRDTLIRKYGRDEAYRLLLTKDITELEKLVEQIKSGGF